MKHFIIMAAILVSTITTAQTIYEKGMQKAFELWQANNWTEAEQLFERIAAAELNEWLPSYYVAQMNSLKSWEEKDMEKVKAQLDKAQEYLNIAMSISKNNPDILVMQAQIYTNWIVVDGMTYGMKYSAKVNDLYNEAYTLAPNNPMVVMCKADWNMGSARYFGQDTKPFCKDLEHAMELFANFKPETPFHPKWGMERAAQVLESCKS